MARYAALLAMSDTRREDAGVIDRALRARSSHVRAAAALAIGQVRAVSLAPRLRTLLADPDTAVAANAAFALGLLRDSASVAVLDSALRRDGPVGGDAAWALGEIGAPAATVIARTLEWPRPPVRALEELLLAAAKLDPPPVSSVTRWLGDPDPEIAWRAAYAIARPRSPAGVRSLLPHALHGDHRVRAQVARGLSREAAGDSLSAAARARLSVMVSDRHPHVRVNAVRSFATYGDSARLALLAAAKDPDPNVRIAAAQVLGPIVRRDLARWAWLWDADTGLAYRQATLIAAAGAGVWLPAVRDWITADDWRKRSAVADAAAATRDPERVRVFLSRFLSDPDPRVRRTIVAAAGLFADSTVSVPWARTALWQAAADSDLHVRAAALTALRRRATAHEAPQLVATYRRALSDRELDAQLAALQSLAAAWRRDSTAFDPSLVAEISSLPPPPEPLLRAVATELPLLRRWPKVDWEPRPMSWYEDIARTYVLRPDTAPPQLATIATERGSIVIELLGVDAPMTVHNFVTLARAGYFDGSRFHRVVPNFVAQDGDPRGDGGGGPGYAIRDELNRRRYLPGTIGMALSGPETGGSQFFLTHSPQPHLVGHYTVFARLIDGWAVLDAIVQGDRIDAVSIR